MGGWTLVESIGSSQSQSRPFNYASHDSGTCRPARPAAVSTAPHDVHSDGVVVNVVVHVRESSYRQLPMYLCAWARPLAGTAQ